MSPLVVSDSYAWLYIRVYWWQGMATDGGQLWMVRLLLETMHLSLLPLVVSDGYR